jgi:hypothetical protein
MKKKNFRDIAVVFIFGILFASCLGGQKEKVNVTVNKFPVNIELTSDYITVDSVLWAPSRLFISGNHFVVRNLMTDTLFSVFSYPDFKYLFSDGVFGNGPDDLPRTIDKDFQVSSKGFNVFFSGINIYREIEIDDVNKKLKTIKEHKYQFQNGGVPQRFTQLGDSRFIYLKGNPMDDAEFFLFDVTRNTVAGSTPYPQWAEGLTGEPNFSIYLSSKVAKPDGNKFAAFYAHFKRWRIFDSEGNLLKDIEVNIPPVVKTSVLLSERMLYYSSAYASDKYIYAVCLNRESNKPRHEQTEFQVWNWEGKPVAKFILDRKFTCFTVSGDSVLYVADNLEGNEDKIFKYILPLSKK